MDPQTPQQRRAFESPLLGDPPASSDRGPVSDRRRRPAWAMLAVILLLAAIILLVVLL